MPEQIGKYHILERIGRGGMGMVFKAHDPVLDRPVALKVISTDVEVTDELRARFFREAQACARLNHPNIITIYDMGEQDGRLFIVMELLDGEELRHLIAKRTPLPLEDKLSVMTQLCDGLHYAHQKGIVHRDVKPGNVFLLRNGQVKILDFGIAQMATTEAGLTRTGLIMGTLRYIAPEQVRGRANASSDLYSVGAVCYELLSLRPPFIGDDALHLLEQLRTEDPTPLHVLDPSLPRELTAVVERAMRKEPADRFADLGSMRAELEKVQRTVSEEAQQTRNRLREEIRQIQELQATLAERLGQTPGQPDIPMIDQRARLQALQALEREVGSRIEALRMQVARADSLAPVVQHANHLLEAGQFAGAVAELEIVVADMSEHSRAQELLARARAQAEQQRRRERVAELLQEAGAALDEDDYAQALEILQQAAEIAPEPRAAQEIDSLRQRAQAGLAAQLAAQRARQQAESVREQMTEARRAAQRHGTRHAAALWNDAEARSTEGQTAFARAAYAQAEQAFEQAAGGYRRFEDAARAAELHERQAAEQARAEAIQCQQHAQASGAPQYARELWDASAAKLAEAHTALTGPQHDRATSLFTEASALYRRAREDAEALQRRERDAKLLREASAALDEEDYARGLEILQQAAEIAPEPRAAQEIDSLRQRAQAGLAAQLAAQRARQQAESVREQMTEARRAAQEHAIRHAAALWNDAEARSTEGQTAFARAAYAQAEQAFKEAAGGYRRFEDAARAAELHERQAAEQARAEAIQCQQQAQASGAPQYARELWDASAAKLAEAHTALTGPQHDRATSLFIEASALYRRAREDAEALQRRERVAKLLLEASAALDEEDHARGLEILEQAAEIAPEPRAAQEIDSLRQRAQAGLAAQLAAQRARQQAESVREQMTEARRTAQEHAIRHAAALWNEAETRSTEGQTAFARAAYAQAEQAFERAAGGYRRFEDAARAAELHERQAAEQARAEATQCQQQAQASGAPQYARELWDASAAKLAEAHTALTGPQHDRATSLFTEASALYRRALEAAREARQRERQRAEEERDHVGHGRRDAAAMGAERYASAPWEEAAAKNRDAEAALTQEQCARAAELFTAARALYRQAESQAREAQRREREQAEEGRGSMLEQRQGALAAEAAMHAAPDWNEAETMAASGEASFTQEAFVAAGQAFEQGAALYRRAGAIAQEAARARADAGKRREAALVARRSATEAQAPKYTSEPWQAAEGVQARANAALERQAYADAQLLFVEARRLYATASRAAGVAAEAEARRIDALMGDAKRLFESGDARACLRRLNALLVLKPGHEAAERLREHAERALERVEAAAREGTPSLAAPGAPSRDAAAPVEPQARAPEPRESPDSLESEEARTAPTVIMAATSGVAAPTQPTAATAPATATPAAGPLDTGAPETPAPETAARVTAGPTPSATGTSATDHPSGAVSTSGARGPSPTRTVSAGPSSVVETGSPVGEPVAQSSSPTPAVEKSFLDDDTVTIFAPPRQMPPVRAESVDRSSPARTTTRGPRHLGRRVAIAVGGLAAVAASVFYLWPSPPAEKPGPTAQLSTPVAAPAKKAPDAQGPPPRPAMVPTENPPAPPAPAPKPAQAPAPAPAAPAPPQLAVVPPPSVAKPSTPAEPAPPPLPAPSMQPGVAPPSLSPSSPSQPGKASPAEPPTARPSLPPPPVRRDALNRPGDKPTPEPASKQTQVALSKRDVEDATQAQRAATEARQEAERSQAPRLAATAFAAAQQKQTEGDALLSRQDASTARLRFLEAQQAYRQAAQEAGPRVAALQRQQSDAEQARSRMEGARRAAEQVTASRYAPAMIAASQAKERDGQAAFGRSDYGQAARLFREAQVDYQAAAEEAKKEADKERSLAERRLGEQKAAQLAALQADTEQSRKGMGTRRDQAVKGEADRLAKNLFDAAQAKQTEADALAGRQSFPEATQAYKDAAERFREAANRAQLVREVRAQADSAKARMLAEKQQAAQSAPEFASAAAEERQANASYERLAFKEAAEKFSSAEGLYARARVVPTPPPPRPDPPAARPAPPRPKPPPPSF